MTGVIANAQLLFDQLGDARQGPEVGGMAVRLGALLKFIAQLCDLGLRQATRTSRRLPTTQGRPPAFAPQLVPLARRRLRDPEPDDDVLLAQAPGEHPARQQSHLFALDPLARVHASANTEPRLWFRYLYETQ